MKVTLLETEMQRVQGPRRCAACGGPMYQFVRTCHRCGALAQPGDDRSGSEGAKSPGVVRIGHLSDLHISKKPIGRVALDVLCAWLQAFRDRDVDVVVISGDLVDNATDTDSLVNARKALEDCAIPWIVVPGNHDVRTPGVRGDFEDYFGTFPRIERKAGVDFILLDSNAGLPLEERTLSERAFWRLFCATEGKVGEAQRIVVETTSQDSSSQVPRVLVLHHHLARQEADPVLSRLPWLKESAIGTMEALHDADAVRAWAIKIGVRMVLHGHKHAMQRAGYHGNDLLVLNGGSSTKSLSADPTIRQYVARTIDLLPSGVRRVSTLQLTV